MFRRSGHCHLTNNDLHILMGSFQLVSTRFKLVVTSGRTLLLPFKKMVHVFYWFYLDLTLKMKEFIAKKKFFFWYINFLKSENGKFKEHQSFRRIVLICCEM